MNTDTTPLVVGDHYTTVQLRVTIALMGSMLDAANEALEEATRGGLYPEAAIEKARLNAQIARRFLTQVTRLLDGEDRNTVHLPR